MNSCLQIFKLDFYGKKFWGWLYSMSCLTGNTNIWKYINNTKKCVTQKTTLKSKGDIKIFKWISPFYITYSGSWHSDVFKILQTLIFCTNHYWDINFKIYPAGIGVTWYTPRGYLKIFSIMLLLVWHCRNTRPQFFQWF